MIDNRVVPYMDWLNVLNDFRLLQSQFEALEAERNELATQAPKKLYQVWSEGFNDMGNIQSAVFHGQAYGVTFLDACRKKFAGDRYYRWDTNSHYTTLYDNETDARKAYG